MSDESKTYDFLTRTLAEQFGMPPEDFRTAVISQCFPGGAATPYQVTQFLMVAYNRKLNPFEKGEIYAFVNKAGVLTIGTGRDGWTKIAHRNPHFKGFKSAEVVGKDGEFLGIHMQMKRDDWEEPGEYTAYLEEWNKQVLNKSGWDNQPRHLTFVKAWQECTKVTFAVTDVATEDEIEAIKSADEETAGQPIYQPAPEPQQAIEHHQPAEVANFTEIKQPEKVPVRKGRPAGSKNKPKGDTADARKSGDLCWVCGDAAKQVQDYGERKFGTCELHASEVHPDEKLIRESWNADKAHEPHKSALASKSSTLTNPNSKPSSASTISNRAALMQPLPNSAPTRLATSRRPTLPGCSKSSRKAWPSWKRLQKEPKCHLKSYSLRDMKTAGDYGPIPLGEYPAKSNCASIRPTPMAP